MKNINFKTKMVFSIAPVMIVVFAVLGMLVYDSTFTNLENIGRNTIQGTAEQNSQILRCEFETYFAISNNYNGFLEDFRKINVSERRDYFFNLTRTMLEYNRSVLAFWADFDANALDGRDAEFAGHPNWCKSGRFNVAFQRGTGNIKIELDDLPEEQLGEDYYNLPRITGKTIVTEPYNYSYTSSMEDALLMTTISSPVNDIDGKIIGVSAIDVSLSELSNFTSTIKPYPSSYASLISPAGLYLSTQSKSLFGKSVAEDPIFPSDIKSKIEKYIEAKEEFNLDFVNDQTNKRTLMFFVPFQVGDTDSRMFLAITVPFEEIVVEAKSQLNIMLLIFSIGLLITIATIFIVAMKLSSPIKKLNSEFSKLAHGNLDLNLSVKSGDETGQLTESALLVTKNVSGLINEMESLVKKISDGDLYARASHSGFEGSYKELVSKTNTMVDRIVEPFELIIDNLKAVTIGEFPDNIEEANYVGHFKQSINRLNTCLTAIKGFYSNISILSDAAGKGDLSNRADTSQFNGEWLVMVNGLNNIMNIFSNLVDDADNVLKIMSTGDLTPRITNNYSGRFDIMKNNINNLGASLSDLISRIKQSVDVTANSSNIITQSADDLALVTSRQNKNTAEIADEIDSISHIVERNAQNAIRTTEVAQQSGKIAKEGQMVVQNTVVKMREIAEMVKISATNIQKLGESSNKIGDIIVVINDIADQTNLLSLNAAIEAARAGEQGRGFAVVADNVGKLAINTATATKEIADMISQIQENTSSAVSAMEKGTGEVNEGIELADKAGNSLGNIINSVTELLNMINNIAESSKSQANAIESIAKNIDIIKNDTAASFSNVENVATNSEELIQHTNQLSVVVNNFIIPE